ncbi:hypothetical protein AURDEDRAFT_166065 [Auricularia subglabra TFB-10046 SS5]|nr:hypothetical protein AURDEDRAFT_166065 [Auricularia subglabra TFB-10046 SS5]
MPGFVPRPLLLVQQQLSPPPSPVRSDSDSEASCGGDELFVVTLPVPTAVHEVAVGVKPRVGSGMKYLASTPSSRRLNSVPPRSPLRLTFLRPISHLTPSD